MDMPLRIEVVEPFWKKNGLSVAALALSLVSLAATFYSNYVARLHAIRDDFWLRQVAYPIGLHPIVESWAVLSKGLPPDCSSAACSSAGTAGFRAGFEARMDENWASLSLIGVLLGVDGKRVYEDMERALFNLEDDVINYCYSNSGGHEPERRPTFPRQRIEQKVKSHLAAFIKPLVRWQQTGKGR